MDSFKVLEIKESVFADNNRQADLLRETLRQKKSFYSISCLPLGQAKQQLLQKPSTH